MVHDYDEAIRWFSEKLGFTVLQDKPIGKGKRFIQLVPGGENGTYPNASIVLAKAETEADKQRAGSQAGGHVFLFLNTDHFDDKYDAMKAAGVEFLETPRDEPYAKVVIFKDLYGNKWDLLQPVE